MGTVSGKRPFSDLSETDLAEYERRIRAMQIPELMREAERFAKAEPETGRSTPAGKPREFRSGLRELETYRPWPSSSKTARGHNARGRPPKRAPQNKSPGAGLLPMSSGPAGNHSRGGGDPP